MKKGSEAPATALAAAVCLGLAATSPWFAVPVSLDLPGDGAPTAVVIAPAGELWFRVACAGLALVIPPLCMLGHLGSVATARLGAVVLGLLLWFPACAVTLDAETGSRAAWLTEEHHSLVWLGGDIARSQGQSGQLRLSDVLVSDAPNSVRVTSLPDWWPGELGLHRLEEVVGWLGYRDSLSAFLCRGWPLALLGAALLMISAARRSPRDRLGVLAGGVKALVVTAVAGAGLVLLVPSFAGSALRDSRDALWRDDYVTAAERLEAAARSFPLLGHDSHFLAQMGLLKCRTGQLEHPAAQLWLARRQIDRGLSYEPEQTAAGLIASPATSPGVRREAARLLSRQGFNALNTGDEQRAVSLLDLAAVVLPVDPKISYSRQLAYLRTEQYGNLADEVEKLRAIYRELALPSSAAVLSNAEDLLARSAVARGDASGAIEHLARRRDPR